MKYKGLSQLVIGLVVTALLVSVLLVGFFFRQETVRRQSEIRFQAYQVLSALVEAYNLSGPETLPLWPEVRGFGIYNSDGTPLYVYGSAPLLLTDFSDPELGRDETASLQVLKIIRRMGGLPPSMSMPPPRRGYRQMMDSMRGSQLIFLEYDASRFYHAGRVTQLVAIALIALFVGIFAVLGFLLRKIDMYRDRERQSAHLIQLGEAARTLAHEIKNPLGIIRIQCATLRRISGEEQQRNIGVIEDETRRLTELTDRVREYLQTPELTVRSVTAAWFLEQSRLRYGEQVAVEGTVPAQAMLECDSDRVLQILDNLIANACEALGENLNGSPTSDRVTLSISAGKKQIRFIVRDGGAGVPAEQRGRLFELFFTTKSRGSGIGLALSRRYAEQNGGTLEYSPGMEGGSVFTLILPLREEGKK